MMAGLGHAYAKHQAVNFKRDDDKITPSRKMCTGAPRCACRASHSASACTRARPLPAPALSCDLYEGHRRKVMSHRP